MYIFSAVLGFIGISSIPLALACVYASHGLLEKKDEKINIPHITVWLCTTPLPIICFLGIAECLLNATTYIGCFGAILTAIDMVVIIPALINKEM